MSRQSMKMVAILFLLLMLAGCNFLPAMDDGEETMVFATPRETPTIEDVEKYGRVQIPESAENVKFYVDWGGIDVLVAVRFEISPENLSEFLSDAGYEEPLQRIEWITWVPGYTLGLDNIIPDWPSDEVWKAAIKDETKVLFGADVDEPGFSRQILVDKTNAELFIIYLVHHSL